MSKNILSILLENQPGALSRVIGLFAQRNFNIKSLNVAQTEDATLSRVTIVTEGNNEMVEKITKQLNKLIDVVKVINISDAAHFECELMLVKIKAVSAASRDEIKRTVDIFRGQIVDTSSTTYTALLTGSSDKLEGFLKVLDYSSILETVRSGSTGIGRGEKMILSVNN
jgi:acetolactate synthase-1/3 small subunit